MLFLMALVAACQQESSVGNPPSDAIRRQERSTLSQVTAVQRWVEVQRIENTSNTAPSILPLIEGDYRLFWASTTFSGIGSATTPDGLRFGLDDGARLANGTAGEPDCVVQYPAVAQVANGYRMYYQGRNAPCDAAQADEATSEFRIFSAFSPDGRVFTREPGVRIEIGEATGLASVRHPRVIQVDDGTFRMFFTGRMAAAPEVDLILSAVSFDAVNWEINTTPIVQNASYPTVTFSDDGLHLYMQFMTDNYLMLNSSDAGATFTPAAWLEFFDSEGNRVTRFGRADILETLDGNMYLYGSGDGASGIRIFQQSAANPTG
jgi:hypothetical protein